MSESDPRVKSTVLLKACDDKFRGDLSTFRDNKKFCDIDLICKRHKFRCHKLILSVQSDYFDHQFNPSNSNGKAVSELHIETDPQLLEVCVNFLYKGKADVHPGQVGGVIKLAGQLGIRQLYCAAKAWQFSNSVVDKTNCLTVYCVAKSQNDASLIARSRQLVLDNLSQLSGHRSFQEICSSCIKELLIDNKLRVSGPKERLGLLLRWASSNIETRAKHLREISKMLPGSDIAAPPVDPALFSPLINRKPKKKVIIKVELENCQGRKEKPGYHYDNCQQRSFVIMTPRHGDGNDMRMTASDEVLIIDLPLTGNTHVLTRLPANVPEFGGVACVSWDSGVLVSGVGYRRKECWQYDLGKKIWQERGRLSCSRTGHCMAFVRGVVWVFGGRYNPTFYSACQVSVEGSKDAGVTWRVCGQIKAGACWNTCCVVHEEQMLIYGVCDASHQSHLLQLYSCEEGSVTHTVRIPQERCEAVHGLAVVQDTVILCSASAMHTLPYNDLLRQDVHQLTKCTSFVAPNTFCVMTVCDDSVLLLGGQPKLTKPDHYLYRAPVADLLQNKASEWEKLRVSWPPGGCWLYPGSCCNAVVKYDHINDSQKSG